MDTERWARIEETIGCSLDPSARRANLLVSGVSLAESRGRILKVGPCRLRLVGETRPCERMDEAFDGLRKVMQEDWGGVPTPRCSTTARSRWATRLTGQARQASYS